MAKALIVLMDRLGYSRYGIQGGDWGSAIAQQMARQAPTRVIGLHLNLITVPPPSPDAMKELTTEEHRRYTSGGIRREVRSLTFSQASRRQLPMP